MAISFTNAGASTTPDVATTTSSGAPATAAWTPATHDLVVCIASLSHTAANSGSNPTCSGNGLTWVSIAHFSTVGTDNTLVVFAANNSAGGATNGATTVTMDGGKTSNGSILEFFYIDGVDLSGGVAAAFVQAVTGEGTSATPSISLSAAGDSNNRPWAVFTSYGSANTITPRTNWTELDELQYLTPNRNTAQQYRSDAFETTASCSISNNTWQGYAFEMKAAASGQTVTGVALSATPSLPAGKLDHSLTGVALSATPTLPAGKLNHGVTGVALSATPSLPAGKLDHGLTGVALSATPSLPAGAVTTPGPQQIDGVVLVVAPSLPAGKLSHGLVGVALSATPTLPAGALKHDLAGATLSVAPSLPVGKLDHGLGGIALSATPFLPAGEVTVPTGPQTVTGVVLTLSPTLPIGQVVKGGGIVEGFEVAYGSMGYGKNRKRKKFTDGYGRTY